MANPRLLATYDDLLMPCGSNLNRTKAVQVVLMGRFYDFLRAASDTGIHAAPMPGIAVVNIYKISEFLADSQAIYVL